MARQPRVEYEGALYHVMARGDRGEAIFRDEGDRKMLMTTLTEACGKTGWRVHAWMLMSNHYHWLVETPEANLVAGMKWAQNTYTRRFNARHGGGGHLFGGRYKAVVVQGDGEGSRDYVATLLDYIHLNPVRAGLLDVTKGRGLLDYPWSSLTQAYAMEPGQRPASWMETARGLALFGCEDTAAGRREFVERLERRAREEGRDSGATIKEGQSLQSTLRRGWYWGGQEFRGWLLERTKGKATSNRNYRTSEQGRAHDEAEAERLFREGLEEMGLMEAQLAGLKGTDARKLVIASRISTETAVPQAWIARKLHMGSAANVSQQLRRWKQGREGEKGK